MGGLIGRLNVQVNIISGLECLQSRFSLTEIIGIEVARRARHVDDVKTREDTDPLDQINSRNHRTRQIELIL